MNNNNLSLNFENRIYSRAFKRFINILLIYLVFSFILDINFIVNVHFFKQEVLYGKKFEFVLNGKEIKLNNIEEKREFLDLLTDFSGKHQRFRFTSYKCLPDVEISTDNYYVNSYECYDHFFRFYLKDFPIGGRFISEKSLNKIFQRYNIRN